MTKENTVAVVANTKHCAEIATLLLYETVLSVDCQGVHLGVNGALTLLQIGTSKGGVYLFDVHTCNDLLSVIQLRTVLECKGIVKVGCLEIQLKVLGTNIFLNT